MNGDDRKRYLNYFSETKFTPPGFVASGEIDGFAVSDQFEIFHLKLKFQDF